MVFVDSVPFIRPRPAVPPPILQRDRKLEHELFRPRRRNDRLRIALLVPLSGPAGLWGPSCQVSATLAAREINSRRGLLGREVELVFMDAGGEPGAIADATLDLITEGGAEAVIGMHISAVRQALVSALRGRIPYVYTPVYEGGERSPNVFLTGETPALQLRPPIHWLSEYRNARRWYFIGNDYVWPRVSHRAARRYVTASGGTVVGEAYIPFGCEDYGAAIDLIRRTKPDTILLSMVGNDSISFNRAFGQSGLARHIRRLSAASEENTLLGIGVENAENLYFAAGYLACLGTPDNTAFLDRYYAAFGKHAPVPNTIGQSCYEGMRLYAEMVARAKSTDVRLLLRASEGLSYRGTRGQVAVRQRHLRSDIYLAEADGIEFRVVEHFAA